MNRSGASSTVPTLTFLRLHRFRAAALYEAPVAGFSLDASRPTDLTRAESWLVDDDLFHLPRCIILEEMTLGASHEKAPYQSMNPIDRLATGLLFVETDCSYGRQKVA